MSFYPENQTDLSPETLHRTILIKGISGMVIGAFLVAASLLGWTHFFGDKTPLLGSAVGAFFVIYYGIDMMKKLAAEKQQSAGQNNPKEPQDK